MSNFFVWQACWQSQKKQNNGIIAAGIAACLENVWEILAFVQENQKTKKKYGEIIQFRN